MLQLDDRVGSAELAEPLRTLGVPVEVTRLQYGDAQFLGNGPDGESTILVGVERKTISDLIQCVKDGRLAGDQLPGLVANYNSPWLVVEGIWREGDDGLLQVYKGRTWDSHRVNPITATQIRRVLLWLRSQAGFETIQTASRSDTVVFLRDLYQWWQKPWDEHTSLHQRHKPAKTNQWGLVVPLPQRMLEELDGMGEVKAAAAASMFSFSDLLNAESPRIWQEIEGVGKALARKFYEQMQSLKTPIGR